MNEENEKKDDVNNLTEEDIRELNLYTEMKRQESIAKYGRDIYDKNSKIGNPKAVKRRDDIDKIIHFINMLKPFIIAGVLIALVVAAWGGLVSDYS